MAEKVPPYSRNPSMISYSRWSRRCDEIDDAAELLGAEGFVQVAKNKLQINVEGDPFAFFHGPDKRQREGGICPLYAGHVLAGADGGPVCKGCGGLQLHSYVETKLCEQGRNIYCPIWRAQQQNQ